MEVPIPFKKPEVAVTVCPAIVVTSPAIKSYNLSAYVLNNEILSFTRLSYFAYSVIVVIGHEDIVLAVQCKAVWTVKLRVCTGAICES